MMRKHLSIALLMLMVVSALAPGLHLPSAHAQDDTDIDTLFRVTLDAGQLPAAPVYMRLLRINMQPGAKSPLHTHPGPEFWRVETGTITVQVGGPATVERSGSEGGPETPATNEDFDVTRGDRVTFPGGTPLTFTNNTAEEVRILAAVILPAADTAPPGVTYVEGQPAVEAFAGIRSDILGDGKLGRLPDAPHRITIDRLTLPVGGDLPAEENPILISVVQPGFNFELNSGRAQITRTAEPGPQPDASAGSRFELDRGDAVFFPFGMKEVRRSTRHEAVTLFRFIVANSDGSVVEANAADIGDIRATGPLVPKDETPEADSEDDATAVPDEEDATAEPDDDEIVSDLFADGQTVYVNSEDVRLRSAASTSSDIVVGLTFGQALTITGPAELGDDIIWWPVTSPDDGSLVGWVAQDFLSADPQI